MVLVVAAAAVVDMVGVVVAAVQHSMWSMVCVCVVGSLLRFHGISHGVYSFDSLKHLVFGRV